METLQTLHPHFRNAGKSPLGFMPPLSKPSLFPGLGSEPLGSGFTNVAALGSGALELEHIEILGWSHMVPQRKKYDKIFKGILRLVFTTRRSENTSV